MRLARRASFLMLTLLVLCAIVSAQTRLQEAVIPAAAEAEPSETSSLRVSPAPSTGESAVPPAAASSLHTGTKADCASFDGGQSKNGVVWCGTASTLAFRVLAERSAPILWFSPEEHLKKKYKIPQPLPCDDRYNSTKSSDSPCKHGDKCVAHLDDKSATVYYQVHRIVRERGSVGDPFDPAALEHGSTGNALGERILKLDKIEKLTLRYYFYYCADCGFGGHGHDLENIELEILIEKEKNGARYRARVAEVVGAAHGVHWFNNRLRVTDDTVFPITILVEEGKHASAPDNDGGGTYEKGLDTNKRVRDAWGLRDALSRRKIIPLFSYYLRGHSNPNRPLNPDNRIGSQAQIDLHPDVFANYRVELKRADTRQKELRQPEKTYELKALGSDCTAEKVKKTGNSGKFDLAGALDRRRAGNAPLVATPSGKVARLFQRTLSLEEDDLLRENLWEQLLQFSFRWDQSHGFAATPPLPKFHVLKVGYFIPRAHFTGFSNGSRRYGLDYLYTPSASRWWEMYAAGGIEWYRPGPGRPFNFGPAWEGGFKFRFPVKKWIFAGVRVGVRTSPTKKFSLVGEPGGGLF
ncbi:MAG TPA: hypothetical protein VGB73_04660 [Pyrinomonadaceae bacterium]|jgi:hypothetical protein